MSARGTPARNLAGISGYLHGRCSHQGVWPGECRGGGGRRMRRGARGCGDQERALGRGCRRRGACAGASRRRGKHGAAPTAYHRCCCCRGRHGVCVRGCCTVGASACAPPSLAPGRHRESCATVTTWLAIPCGPISGPHRHPIYGPDSPTRPTRPSRVTVAGC